MIVSWSTFGLRVILVVADNPAVRGLLASDPFDPKMCLLPLTHNCLVLGVTQGTALDHIGNRMTPSGHNVEVILRLQLLHIS